MTAAHHCHAVGCKQRVPPSLVMCRRHWFMVPKYLRDALWAVYRPGQEDDKKPTKIYLVVQTRLRIAIAEREGHPEAATLTQQLCDVLRRDAFKEEHALEASDNANVMAAFDNVLKDKQELARWRARTRAMAPPQETP